MVKWHIERRFDPKLHRDLPGILSRTDIDAILELACNSYDADSTQVQIVYKPEENFFSIEDNGEGMGTESKLQGFFTRGGSSKAIKRKSPKGRLRIGKFSLAASLLSSLTEEYVLDTRSNGNHVVLREDFRETEGEEYVPDPEVNPASPEDHGTKIELLKLKRKINLEELVFRAARELPVTIDDFKLEINGEKVRPQHIEEASVFFMNERIEGVGDIYGEFYLSPIKLKSGGGIYLKVHGRAVGDPTEPFNLTKQKQGRIKARPGSAIGMAQRVVGFVYADGLDPFIGFDRSSFKEDNPQVIAVHEAIARQLGIIRRYYDEARNEESRRIKLGRYLAAVENVERRFNRADKEFLPRSTCRFELTKEAGDFPVDMDLSNNMIKVNTAHPYFIGIRNPESLEVSLTAAVAFAMTRERIIVKNLVKETGGMDRAFRKGFEVFHPQGKRLVDTLFGTQEASVFDQPEIIEPTRFYRLEELVSLTKLDETTVKELVSAGLFEEPARKPILAPRDITYVEGSSVSNTLKRIGKNKLLIQIVREEFPQLTTEEHLEYADELAYALGEEKDVDNYAKDIGVLSQFFIVPDERIELFRMYIQAHGMLSLKKEVYSHVARSQRHLFVFSIRVPRQHRKNPEKFYKTKTDFLDEYLARDTGARINAHYLEDQHRIVGSILSFDQALLTRAFSQHQYGQQNSIPTELFDHEFGMLRTQRAGQNSFSVLEETPDIYRGVLLS